MRQLVVLFRHDRVAFAGPYADELDEHTKDRNRQNETTEVQVLLVRNPKDHPARGETIVVVIGLAQLGSGVSADRPLKRVAFKIFVENVLTPFDFRLALTFSVSLISQNLLRKSLLRENLFRKSFLRQGITYQSGHQVHRKRQNQRDGQNLKTPNLFPQHGFVLLCGPSHGILLGMNN